MLDGCRTKKSSLCSMVFNWAFGLSAFVIGCCGSDRFSGDTSSFYPFNYYWMASKSVLVLFNENCHCYVIDRYKMSKQWTQNVAQKTPFSGSIEIYSELFNPKISLVCSIDLLCIEAPLHFKNTVRMKTPHKVRDFFNFQCIFGHKSHRWKIHCVELDSMLKLISIYGL